MLSEPLNLNRVNATELIDYLYSFFHRDFVASKTYLNKHIYINPRSHHLDEGKECDFWHLTTREEKIQVKEGNKWVWKNTGRYPDYRRAERIEWVKQIITQHNHANVKCFYHQESNPKKDIRFYLWAYDNDFVVILQKLGRSESFLVTSFYIDHVGKRRDYETRYQRYLAGEDENLKGCEWF